MVFGELTDSKLAGVYPDLAVRWRRVAQDLWNAHRVQLKVTEGMRDFATQWALFGKGRKKEKNGLWVVTDKNLVVTNAKPGTSFHQYGLALDSCFSGSDPYLTTVPKADSEFLWSEYGRFCQGNGLVWGGDFNGNGVHDKEDFDKPHCQIGYGMSIHEIQTIYEFGGIKGVWAKCDKIIQCGGLV